MNKQHICYRKIINFPLLWKVCNHHRHARHMQALQQWRENLKSPWWCMEKITYTNFMSWKEHTPHMLDSQFYPHEFSWDGISIKRSLTMLEVHSNLLSLDWNRDEHAAKIFGLLAVAGNGHDCCEHKHIQKYLNYLYNFLRNSFWRHRNKYSVRWLKSIALVG